MPMSTQQRNFQRGFTLIELLIVIIIIALLATIVFVALDPMKRFRDARNSRRWNDVNNILTAIQLYNIDSKGKNWPTGLDATEKQLGTDGSGCATICTSAAAACLDISSDLSPYLKSIPQDPDGGTAGKTYYSVQKDANNIVTVKACNAEGGETIQVSR